MTDARVGVVVLNFNGGDMTLQCLDALRRCEPSGKRVVLVDNASTDGVVATVRREHPDVEVVASDRNLGFAGGCNLGIQHLGDSVDYIALLNNDAVPERAWLVELLRAAAASGDIGAVSSKMLFFDGYAEVAIHATTRRRGRGDPRPLGARIRTAGSVQFASGWWGPEPDGAGQWSTTDARLLVRPGDDGAAHLEVLADVATEVVLRSDAAELRVQAGPSPHPVQVAVGTPRSFVNNAGCVLTSDFYGADRGCFEPADAYDEPADVFAWSGGSVLLRRAYLDDVGLFDERFFLYYEDFDLSWRGRARGWRHVYAPASVVRHRHGATTGIGSARTSYFNERNRLLTLLRNAPARVVIDALVRYVLVTASYARRDVVSPVLRGRQPRPTMTAGRLRAALGFLALAPHGLVSRRRLRRRQTVADDVLLGWRGR